MYLGPNSQSVQAHKSQLEGPGRQKEKFFVDEETDCVRCKLTRRSCSTVTSAASPPGRKQTSRRSSGKFIQRNLTQAVINESYH